MRFLFYNENFNERIFYKPPLSPHFIRMSFLKVQSDSVGLFVFRRYLKDACSKTTCLQINQFPKTTMKWKTGDFFTIIVDNFNGCELNVGMFSNKTFIEETIASGSTIRSGPSVAIFETLAERLNFQVSYKHTKDGSTRIDYVYNARTLFAASHYPMHLTTTYKSSDTFFQITPGELYSPFEKLYIPFDIDTWVWIGVVFVVALIVITIVGFSPKDAQIFVFGRNVNTPVLNLLFVCWR